MDCRLFQLPHFSDFGTESRNHPPFMELSRFVFMIVAMVRSFLRIDV